MVRERYISMFCLRRGASVQFRTSRTVRTDVAGPNRTSSRLQPEVDILAAHGAGLGGIWPQSLLQLPGAHRKVRKAVIATGKDCAMDELLRHVESMQADAEVRR
uniref:Uncharacterized protein n=1 Tax=Odontella aurita TaxID=265563 RepID=A0A7S4MX28_9STRA|mmetsp:Transcript_37905/g.113276  ORF Transcript_37905/g.113276 Transcript_37905/m.113276 type:complete len:104 (+) Transcript_37905:310-621(+)